jgi:hypothetical protein
MTLTPKDIEDIAKCVAFIHIYADEKKVKDSAGNLQVSLVHVNRVFSHLVGNHTSSKGSYTDWKPPKDSVDPNLSMMDFDDMVKKAKKRIKEKGLQENYVGAPLPTGEEK